MAEIIRAGKAAVFYNTAGLTLEEIKKNTGATHAINGYFFDGQLNPLGWLVIDGKVRSRSDYNDWGLGIIGGKPYMTTDRSETFLDGVPILKEGAKLQRSLTPDVARRAERTAIGWTEDLRVVLWCSREKLTREELQDKLLKIGAVDALMMDGGGSTQCIYPDRSLYSSRIVATVILLWEENKCEEEPTMLKLALGAGHGIHTEGKRCLKSIDPNETREWWLNDRICDYVEQYLAEYEGYSLLRLDDSDDGEENVPLAERVKKANSWGADFYLSVHHNAGINGGTGGGIIAFTYPGASAASRAWRDELYDALIRHTGLKGNRSTPKAEGNYYVLKQTTMPAVLLELGFMDSKTDVPVILTDEYAQQCARAIVEVLVKRGKLTKKQAIFPNDACRRAAEKGIFVGDGAGNYRWGDGVTRSELCIVLDRLGLL